MHLLALSVLAIVAVASADECPLGWTFNAMGLWSNPLPCGAYPTPPSCTDKDAENNTAVLCGRKCSNTAGCLAFELFDESLCSIFVGELKQPFVPNTGSLTCVRDMQNGMHLGNGTFMLNGKEIRLFAGSLQHFRIHPDHWEHRILLAKAMGLNTVQTLIPWMMMEPNPSEFVTGGFMDIVRFTKLCQTHGMLMVLRPGPFISDGPDYGGFPWWLSAPNTDATSDGSGGILRVRSAGPLFLKRVDMFLTKVFALLRANKLLANQGGPIVMAQIDNEYGYFGHDKAYLEHLRDFWRDNLGDGVVIHSTDPPIPRVLGATRLPGVLQTVDFDYRGDASSYFSMLKGSQAVVSDIPQPLMCSEIYPGNLNYWSDQNFPNNYPPDGVASSIDNLLNTTLSGGSTSFALWLFASCTDFGYWGGTLFLGEWKPLIPTYDFGGPVDEAGVVRPLFGMLQTVLAKHGAVINTTLPPQPPVVAYGVVAMNEVLSLWDALPYLAPQPVKSSGVRTMEELGQGYGYILYSAPVPSFMGANTSFSMGGMRDRAEIYYDKTFAQACYRNPTVVDSHVCDPAVPFTGVPSQIDILVENMGRPCGGWEDAVVMYRGIQRFVEYNQQILSDYKIYNLPLTNVSTALVAHWKPVGPVPVQPPLFFRGQFTIQPGQVGDTFLTLIGWQKGQAFVNGNNVARYWGAVGPQYSFYVPAGWLHEGVNEVILFETSGLPTNMTVEFKAAHTIVTNGVIKLGHSEPAQATK